MKNEDAIINTHVMTLQGIIYNRQGNYLSIKLLWILCKNVKKAYVLCTFFTFYDFYDFYANYEPTYNMLKYPSMYLYGKLPHSL